MTGMQSIPLGSVSHTDSVTGSGDISLIPVMLAWESVPSEKTPSPPKSNGSPRMTLKSASKEMASWFRSSISSRASRIAPSFPTHPTPKRSVHARSTLHNPVRQDPPSAAGALPFLSPFLLLCLGRRPGADGSQKFRDGFYRREFLHPQAGPGRTLPKKPRPVVLLTGRTLWGERPVFTPEPSGMLGKIPRRPRCDESWTTSKEKRSRRN